MDGTKKYEWNALPKHENMRGTDGTHSIWTRLEQLTTMKEGRNNKLCMKEEGCLMMAARGNTVINNNNFSTQKLTTQKMNK